MPTAAFRSTTRASNAVGGADNPGSSGSTGVHRRSRSLSRYSGRFPPADGEEFPAPSRGRFVNTVRGSGFPEISLDDLADEFFAAGDLEDEAERGRGGARPGPRRLSDAGFLMETESSRRRGRSVSRKGSFESNGGVRGGLESSARRRRSVSVARYRCSDSEKCSTLTDDETRSGSTNKAGSEKTIGVVYDERKTEHPVGDGEGNGLYEAMRKEVRHAVDEIRTELEKVIMKTKPAVQGDAIGFQPNGSEVVEAIAEIRRNYTTKLEESEKRKQDLLAELAAEEQRGQELTKIVKELLPGKKKTMPERPARFRRRSNDKTRMSEHLSEEAEKYFEDFISSVEDTDLSSFDGERSDGSSTVRGNTKLSAVRGIPARLGKAVSFPAETDGLVLPWLEWETCYDSIQSCKNKEASFANTSIFSSSRGSWSPGDNGNYSVVSENKMGSDIKDAGCCPDNEAKSKPRISSFNMEEYMHLQHTEDFLFEGLQQRQRIESGGLILCGRSFVSYQ